MSMLCQVCMRNKINALKPPHGGYICQQSHFQCINCMKAHGKCGICGGSTQFLQFSIVKSDPYVDNNELVSQDLESDVESQEGDLARQIDSLPTVLMEEQDLHRIYETLSRNTGDRNLLESGRKQSVVALMPVKQDPELLKLPQNDNSPTTSAPVSQNNIRKKRSLEERSDKDLHQGLHDLNKVANFQDSNDLQESERSKLLLSGPAGQSEKQSQSKNGSKDLSLSEPDNHLYIQENAPRTRHRRAVVESDNSLKSNALESRGLDEVKDNNLNREFADEAKINENYLNYLKKIPKTVPMILIPLGELLNDSTILETISFQTAMLSLAKQEQTQEGIKKLLRNTLPSYHSESFEKQARQQHAQEQESAAKLEKSYKDVSTTTSTSLTSEKRSEAILPAEKKAPQQAPQPTLPTQPTEQTETKDSPRRKAPAPSPPLSANAAAYQKYVVMHASETVPFKFEANQVDAQYFEEPAKSKATVDERYMKLLQSFMEVKPEAKPESGKAPASTQMFEQEFSDTKQNLTQLGATPKKSDLSPQEDCGIKKRIEAFNCVEPPQKRSSLKENFERPASQIVLEEHQNSTILNEIISQQKIPSEPQPTNEASVVDARFVLLNRAPLRCPIHECNQSLFVSDFCQHIVFEHHNVPLERAKPGQEKIFFCDVRSLARNVPRCVMCYFLRDVVRNVGSTDFGDYLPIMVMAARIKADQMYNVATEEEPDSDDPTTDCFFLWLTGLVPEKRPIGFELLVYPLHSKRSDVHMGFKNYVYSLRNSQVPYDIWNNGAGMLFYPQEILKLTNKMQDILVMKLVIS